MTPASAAALALPEPAKFFTAIRPLFGSLTPSQVAGAERLVSAFQAHAVIQDRRHLAYVLGTSFHETGRRLQPVREAYGTSTADTIRKLDAAWKKGQLTWVRTPYWRGGWFGRGDVQITHESNYSGAIRDAVLATFGVDIHKDPDAVLRGDVSAFALIEGVTRGLSKRPDFTAYGLEDFLTPTKTDYVNARKTVNPGEKSTYKVVAAYAEAFEKALIAGGMGLHPGEAPAPPKPAPKPAPAPMAKKAKPRAAVKRKTHR